MQRETELKDFGAQTAGTTRDGGDILSATTSAVDLEERTEFGSRTSHYRSETSSSKLQSVPLEEAATRKLQAVAKELLPQESFIVRKRELLLQSTAVDGAASAEFADESVGQFSDEFCAKIASKTREEEMPYRTAVMEVIIDGLLERCDGNYDKALLHVVCNYHPESKVQTYAERLLSVHKASAVVADEQMKTCLHHAVEKKYLGVIQVLVNNDAWIMARDRDGKMPVEIAIDLKNDDIASFLISKMPHERVRALFEGRDTPARYIFQELITGIQMQETIMAVLDSMMDPIEGRPDYYKVFYHILDGDWNGRAPSHPQFVSSGRSCLQIIAKSNNKEAVYHDVVRLLLRLKWKTYVGIRFRFHAILFGWFLFNLTFALVVAGVADDPLVYDSPVQTLRGFCEVFVTLQWIWDLLSELNQMKKHRLHYLSDYYNYLDLSSVVFIFTILPLRLAENDAQWTIASIAYMATTLRIFKFASASRTVGQYARICGRIIREDMTRFSIIFILFLMSFSGSLFLALRGETRTAVDNESNRTQSQSNLGLFSETSTYQDILLTGIRIMIEQDPIVLYRGDSGSRGFGWLGVVIMLLFMFAVIVVLLNILIAQLSDTYQNVQSDAQRELEINRAWIVARIEHNSIIFTNLRKKHYQEVELVENPQGVLEKWEVPPMNTMRKTLAKMDETVTNHDQALKAIKSQLETQTNLLQRLVAQLQQVQDAMSLIGTSPQLQPVQTGSIVLSTREHAVRSEALQELVDQLEYDV